MGDGHHHGLKHMSSLVQKHNWPCMSHSHFTLKPQNFLLLLLVLPLLIILAPPLSSMSEHSAAGGATLYCRNEDADEGVQSHSDAWISTHSVPHDDSVILHLFDSEAQQGNLHTDSLRHLTPRQDSINWILKVTSSTRILRFP